MFGLGMGELLVILALALLFLGPKRLPDVASTLGKAIRSFRKATSDLQDQLEVDESVKAPFRELKAALRDEPAPMSVQQPLKLDQQHLEPPKGDAKADAAKPEVAKAEAPKVDAPKVDAAKPAAKPEPPAPVVTPAPEKGTA